MSVCEAKKESMVGRESESEPEKNMEEGGGEVCAMQRSHVKMNRGKAEPRVMLQEHSSGWGVGLYINRWINPGEECVPSAKCAPQRLAGA